nr:immunoglobulin heavy chain junction region [Macaca mulatta]MOW20433.1 immunoglobulin heavy chain junction region [Macaca mulatta]
CTREAHYYYNRFDVW